MIHLLVIFLVLFPSCLYATAPHKPNTMVADWIKGKLGSHDVSMMKPKLWMYQGCLYDPLDGRKIANVQGLEWIYNHNISESILQTNKIQSLLKHPNTTYDQAATLWIRKVFCYTTMEEDNPQLLREIRVRPNSPCKDIPLDQSVSLWETTTTYISRGDDFLVHSEWPDGKHLWGETSAPKITSSSTDENKATNYEFTIYTKHRSPKSRLYLPDLTTTTTRTTTSDSSNDVVEATISPKRSALIQFGNGNMESKNKFGARETYSLSFLPSTIKERKRWGLFRRPSSVVTSSASSSTVKYTRYGEGPPFYAPGRMCMLELNGRPIETLNEATPLLSKLVKERIHTGEEFGNFQLIPDENDIPKTRWGRQVQTIGKAYESLCDLTNAATSLQPAVRLVNWLRRKPSISI